MTPTPDRSAPLGGRILRRARILGGTALAAAFSLGAVILASNVIAAGTVRIEAGAAEATLPVRTVAVALQQSYEVPQDFIGRVEPRQDSVLGFEIGGTVVELLADEGDEVAEGQVLAQLDTRAIAAQIAEAKAARDALAAQLELARLTYERQKALADRSFASQQNADEARLAVTELEARIAQTEASVELAEVQRDKSTLRAPFAGRVALRHVDEGSQVAATAPVLELQEDGRPRVRVGLLPALAAALSPGDSFDVTIEGRPLRAVFASRRAGIDPVTRTLPVLFDLEDAAGTLPYGAVVRLTVMRDVAETGAWLPLSALSEGPRGLWTLLVVDDTDGTARLSREAVEVIHADGARAFVRGALEDGMLVVADGTHRVAPGQPVALAGR
ncbi:efflux RND transporter periplasmic adaptor subunit [Poseidonocella sp. HB161398]|uniref:efflux RND transporter periplasmic adaptor subunit n=1 Tax=Poseidonocella sp. HB161398 TaxID=2320855 RepID=UPI00110876BC|nr:efflux RND transporter periplasmic adaptor subunit [Poseidonocella sp. HB161398]